jgi:hypothetical protein
MDDAPRMRTLIPPSVRVTVTPATRPLRISSIDCPGACWMSFEVSSELDGGGLVSAGRWAELQPTTRAAAIPGSSRRREENEVIGTSGKRMRK